MSQIVLIPISDKQRVVRERVLHILHSRPDFRDAVAQFCLLMQQLHNDKYTGEVRINFGQGSVRDIHLIDLQK